MKKTGLLSLFFFLTALMLSSCQKESVSGGSGNGATAISALKIDPKFDFANSADVTVSIQVETTESRPTPQLIRIYNANPDRKSVV